jgi:hypothetical protein
MVGQWAGLYTLQYASYNSMPVYKQHSWLCHAPKAESIPITPQLHCTSKEKPNHIFYDSLRNMWKVAGDLGGDEHFYAQDAVMEPQDVPKGKWTRMTMDGTVVLKTLTISCCESEACQTSLAHKKAAAVSSTNTNNPPINLHKKLMNFSLQQPIDQSTDSRCVG